MQSTNYILKLFCSGKYNKNLLNSASIYVDCKEFFSLKPLTQLKLLGRSCWFPATNQCVLLLVVWCNLEAKWLWVVVVWSLAFWMRGKPVLSPPLLMQRVSAPRVSAPILRKLRGLHFHVSHVSALFTKEVMGLQEFWNPELRNIDVRHLWFETGWIKINHF